jgi:DNA primase
MPDERDLIRSRIDLVELVGERVKLTRSGKKWKGLCPFHAEKTPSFYVDSELQLFHCFGCKKGGDVFAWVMETEAVDFRAAIEGLAQRTGVELPKHGGKPDDSKRKVEIMEEAALFFRDAFRKNESAIAYARSRGLDEATCDAWQIGYAPASEFALATFLKNKGFLLKECGELGLLTETGSGFMDFFRNRLMFPIRDEQGKLVGLSGRSMDGTDPKYINSRESSLFNKGATLFGLHQARPMLRADRRAVLVEGQMDVIACQRAGVPACAPLGTALTETQAQKLKRFADEAVVFYDGDNAGRAAAEKAFEALGAVGLRRSAVVAAAGEDPDSILASEGGEGLSKRVENRVSPTRYRISWLMREHDAHAGITKPEFWEAVEGVLADSPSLLEVDALVDELSALHPNAKVDRMGVVRSLRGDIEARRKRRDTRKSTVIKEGTIEKPRGPERLLILAALDPVFREQAWPLLAEEDLIVSDGGRTLADALLRISMEPPTGDRAAIATQVDPDVQTALMALEATNDPFGGMAEPLNKAVIEDARQRLLKEKARRLRLRQYEADRKAETLEQMYGRTTREPGE